MWRNQGGNVEDRRYLENLYDALPDEAVEKEEIALPKRISKNDLLRNTVFVMKKEPMRGKDRTLWPRFELSFHVIKNPSGEHVYLEENPIDVIRYVNEQKIIDAIMDYWQTKTPWIYKTKTTIKEATAVEAFKFWAASTRGFDQEIAPIKQLDWPGYCFHHLPFNFALDEIDLEKDCPAFHEMFSRMTNAKAFMAWIGSLFDPKSSRQQYVWLYGDGRNGKSTLGRILARIMGPAVRFEHPPEKGDKFWTHGLLGKRLIIFGDCNNYCYPSSGQFKALTGEDQVRVEAKGKPSYSVDLFCKFLFFSNEVPAINGGESNKRRAIFCEIGPVAKEFGPTYEQILWGEVPAFIGKCRKIYAEVIKDSHVIPVEQEGLLQLIEENESRFEYFVEKYLNIHSDEALDMDWLNPFQLQDMFKEEKIVSVHEQKNYLGYLKRKYGVRKLYQLKDGKRKWVYTNCSAKSTPKV